MSAYQGGDAEAFEELYWALGPRLRNYLAALARSRGRAEDLLQETFLQIHRSRATYMPGRAVAPWAFSIARHVYLMDRRRQFRRQAREVSVEDPPELPVPPEVKTIGESWLLQQALAQLPAKHLEAILLHHIWGFTFKEIGQTLGLRTVTAKLRAHRGMKKLRKILVTSVTKEPGEAKLKERPENQSPGNGK